MFCPEGPLQPQPTQIQAIIIEEPLSRTHILTSPHCLHDHFERLCKLEGTQNLSAAIITIS